MIGWFRKQLERRAIKRRLANMTLNDRCACPPFVVHDFCPACGRDMSEKAHPMVEITPHGERIIMVCDTCKALGPLDSIITAEAERSGASHQPAQVSPPGRVLSGNGRPSRCPADMTASRDFLSNHSGLSALPVPQKKGS